MGNFVTRLAVPAILSLSASQSFAAFCQDTYGSTGLTTLEGATVCFVYDPGGIDPLFGSLSHSGDNIFATPTAFKALSNDGAGTATVIGTGTIQVVAKPGWALDGINVGEIGDYRMTAGGTSVDVDGWLRVFDWFDSTPVFGTEETTTMAITGDLTIQDNNLHNWTATGSFDLGTPLWNDRDHVGLTLQNTLNAFSSAAGESAMIQKKAIGSGISVSIFTTPVPLPAAIWVFASGLLGLVAVARRRS